MNFKLLLLSLFIFNIGFSQDEELDEASLKHVEKIISIFKTNNIQEVSNAISYPLTREYPIPSVKDEAELKSRYNEIFDENLIAEIANSKPEQWSEVGWRGIMLNFGIVWLDVDEGKITAVNYQSDFERKMQEELIYNDKEELHASLQDFDTPVYKITTSKFLIRIDALENGKYRYASWKINKKESSKPDLILTNGKMEIQGTGGNHAVVFTNKNYTYSIFRNIIGREKEPDVTLVVEKDNQTILTQDGMLMVDE